MTELVSTTTTTPEPAPEPAGEWTTEVAIVVKRKAMKVGDLFLLERVQKAQVAYMLKQPRPEDAPHDAECWEFFDRVIEGGMEVIRELPIDAIPQVWAAIRAVAYPKAHEKN